MRRLFFLLLILILVGGILGQGYVALNQRSAQQELASAGFVHLGKLDTDLPPETILPPCTAQDNAAVHYVAALNAYNARRRVPRDKSKPLIQEPPIADGELREVVLGSRCCECDFYVRRNGVPALSFLQSDRTRRPFEVATDPFDARSYVPALRMLSEVALREGKRQERKGTAGSRRWAESIYLAVLRMACHLRRAPGSFMDVQLGLEIERQAAHYLDVFYRVTNDRRKRRLCWKYGDSLNRLSAEVRRKYAQLGNFEAAREIALQDKDRVWRIQAIAALRERTGESWWRNRRANAVFEVLSAASDLDVARAARRAVHLAGRDEGPEERHEPLGSRHKEPPTQL